MNSAEGDHQEIQGGNEKEIQEHIARALGQLVFEQYDNQTLYRAGEPGYPYFFYRDSSDAALLLDDRELRKANIAYAAHLQGAKYNLQTGEEPGKIAHEKHHTLPDMIMHNGMSTSYNACDTTAMFLKDIAMIAGDGETEILSYYDDNIESAIRYIQLHVDDGLFYEDPLIAGGNSYGLKVTYWKDSVLNDPDRIEPHYPIVYTQVHFQNAEALLSIGQVQGNEELIAFAKDMFAKGIQKLWAGDHFVTAIDTVGRIDPPSCDSLLSLLYIPPELLPEGFAQKIENYMIPLETAAGYLPGRKVGLSDDEYHIRYIWTHVQALHHLAATKHNLKRAQAVSRRVVDYFDPDGGVFPELLDPTNNYEHAGNKLQLWSVAAYKYFMSLPQNQAV